MTHQAQITTSIKTYMDKARELFPTANLPNPTISFKMRGGTGFGQARYGAGTFMIRINDQISGKYLHDALTDTVPHEVAHLVAYKVYGRCQGHNSNWKRIMRAFGIANPERTAKGFDTLEFKQFKAQTKYVYNCGRADCEHRVGSKVHKKLQFGSVYTCKLTGGKLARATFVKNERKTAEQRKVEAYKRAGKDLPGTAAPKVPAPAKAAKAARAPASHKRPTKKDRAESLYLTVKGRPRPDVIALFMSHLDMTTAGAGTYYANCKKKLG